MRRARDSSRRAGRAASRARVARRSSRNRASAGSDRRCAARRTRLSRFGVRRRDGPAPASSGASASAISASCGESSATRSSAAPPPHAAPCAPARTGATTPSGRSRSLGMRAKSCSAMPGAPHAPASCPVRKTTQPNSGPSNATEPARGRWSPLPSQPTSASPDSNVRRASARSRAARTSMRSRKALPRAAFGLRTSTSSPRPSAARNAPVPSGASDENPRGTRAVSGLASATATRAGSLAGTNQREGIGRIGRDVAELAEHGAAAALARAFERKEGVLRGQGACRLP